MAGIHSNKSNPSRIGNMGLYTVSMASRLIGATPQLLHSWIDGYSQSEALPIIQRQLPRIGGKTVLGFLDLIEAKFVHHFRTLGLSPQTIRKVATKLSARHDIDHPFAMDHRFRTDGRAIFMETAESDEERKILNLMNDNFEIGDVIDRSLFKRILYASDLASRWHPNEITPDVIVDPKYAFGHPVVEGFYVPTKTLYDAFRIEGSAKNAAEEYDVSEDAVMQSVKFEQAFREGMLN